MVRNYDIYSIEQRVYELEKGGTPTPGGGSWDYSTDEVYTKQKWTDGKEIYCKVITGTFNFTANTPVTIVAKGDMESIVDFRVFAESGIASPQAYFDSDNYVKGFHFARFDAIKAIIYYTKATTAKSTKRSSKK